MPIDPSIVLGAQPVQIGNPLSILSGVLQVRNQIEGSRALAEQRQALADQRRFELEQSQRTAAEDQALRGLDAWTPETVFPIVGPERGAKILEGLSTLQGAQIKTHGELQTALGRTLGALDALPESMRPEAYQHARSVFVQRGWIDPSQVPEEYDPAFVSQASRAAMTPEQQYDAAHPKGITVSPGTSVVNPQNGQVLYTAPEAEKHSAIYQEWQDAKSQGYTGSFEKYQNEDANRRRPTVNVGAMGQLYGQVDPKAIADGIVSGQIPPDVASLGKPAQAAVLSELAKRGYNLAKSNQDWKATSKHFATLNGPQQTRLRQAADTALHSLDVIEDLSNKWAGGRFPVLNRANLAAARNGVLGADAQAIATQLEAQIADVTSEMANVYMGGNSPTDHAMQLAAKNLSADWSPSQLKSALELGRQNLKIRLNSITNTGVISPSGAENPYAPQPVAPAAPAGHGGPVSMVAPDGRRLSVPPGDVDRLTALGARVVQ